MRKHFRVTDKLHGNNFFVHEPDPKTGKIVRWMTPLFLALVLIEIADLVFAVDSVPAVFAITTDPYIVYTSNIFAILGLRALYFALAAVLHRFHYLKYALAILLVFIGSKIIRGRPLRVGEVPCLVVAGHHLRDPGCGCRLLALEIAERSAVALDESAKSSA